MFLMQFLSQYIMMKKSTHLKKRESKKKHKKLTIVEISILELQKDLKQFRTEKKIGKK